MLGQQNIKKKETRAYVLCLTMTDITTSENNDLSSLITLYIYIGYISLYT